MTRAVLLAVAAAGIATWALAAGVAARAEAPPPGARRGTRVVELVRALGRRAGVPAAPLDLRCRIAAAGLDLRVTPADVMAVKGGSALLALAALLPAAVALPGGLVLAAVLAGPAAAFLIPDHALRRRSAARARRIRRELADVLDLLRVAVASGLPVVRAMDEVGRRHPGLLAAELRRTGREVAVGVRRRDAFRALGERCPVPAVAALVAAIERADRHGAPLAPALAALALDARADRARALQDEAARAAPKIQLVIALMLVPGVLLLVGAALLGSLGS